MGTMGADCGADEPMDTPLKPYLVEHPRTRITLKPLIVTYYKTSSIGECIDLWYNKQADVFLGDPSGIDMHRTLKAVRPCFRRRYDNR